MPPLKLSRRTNESLRFCVGGAAACTVPIPTLALGAAGMTVLAPAPGGELAVPGVDEDIDDGSPGTTPWPDRRAMSARIALSHLISSSSLGAHRSSVRFVVTTLNVCVPAASPSSGPDDDAW